MAGFKVPAIDDGDDPPFGLASHRGGCVAGANSTAGAVGQGRARRPAASALPVVSGPAGLAGPAATAWPAGADGLLGLGARGVLVEKAQRLLNALSQPSPGLVVDGRFGRQTAAAVTEYQDRLGLRIDGLVGPQTWQALRQGRVARRRSVSPLAKAQATTAGVPFNQLKSVEPKAPTEVLHPIKLHLMPLPLVKPPAWWPQAAAKPYAAEPFGATLTNASKQGTLDGDGRVGYEQLPPGSCEFVFKDFYKKIEAALAPPGP